mgnify:CR=1 FL=1
MENTIVAISTAMGNGGIGIVRMSGEKSFEILDKIFRPKNNDGVIKGYQIKYGNIIDPKNEEIVDEVLVSYFVAPKSYTTENMCEINTHGGMVVEKRILELCLENGAEIAGPGEFTKRAFLNGRIDLSQAEAIIDLINSKTVREAKESINQLEGHLSNKIENIRQKMLNLMIAIDVNIDYPEYDEEEVTKNRSLGELRIISEELIKLENSFNSGKILRDGVKTVILGKTNAGKSSLLNRILKEDRAIVSNIEGTTRDTIEEFVDVEGIPLKLIDTAGIRNSSNEIEQIGIQKSKKLADSADLIIAIFDITKNLTEDDEELLEIIKDKECIILLNKIDVLSENFELEKCLKSINKNILKVSAMEDIGIQGLFDKIVEIYSFNNESLSNDVLISNERHKNLIQKARIEIDEAINAAENDMYIDIISIYITNAMNYLAEITGNNVTDDVIFSKIFKRNQLLMLTNVSKENYEKFEGGTLDAAGIYALGKAIEYIQDVGVNNIEKHLKKLTKYTLEKLKKEVKNIKIYATKNTCGIVTFAIDNIHAHDIISILNLENISVRAGHHCAMPLHRYIDEVSTLRLSFGMYTTKEEIDYAISKIVRIGELFNGNI